MGQAGKVLRQVLETYGISQNRLAKVLGVGASNVYRWVNEVRDPNSETVISLVKALQVMNSEAAQAFKDLYFSDGSTEDPDDKEN